MLKISGLAVSALTVALVSVAHAADWNESIHGDLSNDPQSPTPLVFDLGINRIIGSMGMPPGGPLDPDFFRFTLQSGEFLVSIFVESIMPSEASFYAIAAGPTINTTDGSTHLSNILIEGPGEYFDDLAFPMFGGQGISQPLGAGEYTVWFQETALARDYVMRYTVVPEPAVLSLVAAAATVILRRGPRCRQS